MEHDIRQRVAETIFYNKPVTSLKCNKNFKELIGSNQIENDIVKKINKAL